MVSHVVIFTWLAGTTAQQVSELKLALDAMAAELSDIGTIRHGPDLRYRGGNGDYAIFASFPDRAAWEAYQAHPSHKAFVRDRAGPLQASRAAIQF